MKIKKYVARDFQSALQLAKQEMGPDAIILQTRQVKPRGFRGWFSPPQVEITVAVDDTLQVNTDKARQSTAKPVEPEGAAAKPAVMMTDPGAELGLMQEMQKMKAMMSDIQARMFEVDLLKGMADALFL